MKINDLFQLASQTLSFSDTPQLDAQVLIAHFFNKSRSWVPAHLDEDVTEKQKEEIDLALIRLGAGEPFPYVLGKWEFFGLEFDVTKDVLIPRPETELLVEKAITYLKATSDKKSIVDIGTGSGAIAISLALNVPNADILATDISPAALQVAKRNAQKFNVDSKIEFIECDLLPSSSFILQPSSLNLICANLPYIPTEIMRGLPIFGREPTLALDGGLDGLDLFRKLFKLAPAYLAPRALLLLEIESSLGAQMIELVSEFFPRANIRLHQDLAGKNRLLEIETAKGIIP